MLIQFDEEREQAKLNRIVESRSQEQAMPPAIPFLVAGTDRKGGE